MDKIAVLDFGGQYAHLIANRIRRMGVYSEIFDGEVEPNKLLDFKGVILSGGPASVQAETSPKCDARIFELGVPILGICYGHQLMAMTLGGEVEHGEVREYGPAEVNFLKKGGIFEGVEDVEPVWMSHFDQVVELPDGFELIGKTDDCPIAAMANFGQNLFGVQFHPEVTHTPCGQKILENFIQLTDAKREWSIETYIEDITKQIQNQAKNKKVFLMISGGVDSTVAFLLLAKALGPEKVYGLFVDTGFMRMNERKEVEEALKSVGVTNLHVYDAGEEYFAKLKGVYEPEEKRKIIGDLFLDIQQKVSDKLRLNPEEWLLGQGTIYPDTIETGGTKHADKIKTHHNQVQRIKDMTAAGKMIEPLKQLYKDEVRLVGEKLGLAHKMVWRHPFPGPGLAVRCLCVKNPETIKEPDGLAKLAGEFGLKAKVLPIKSVGVQGDERTYRHPVVVYGKANSWEDLNTLSTQMTNQFTDINRVLLGLRPEAFDGLTTHDAYLTKERISILQEADKIVMDFIVEHGMDHDIWQFPTVLVPLGGESIVLRPVESEEAMTANFYQMNFEKLNELVKRLGSIKSIGAIFYDITNKPPATIEWE